MSDFLFENTDQYILITDLQGNIVKWNPKTQQLFNQNFTSSHDKSLKTICNELGINCPLPDDITDLINGVVLLKQNVIFHSLQEIISFKIMAHDNEIYLFGTNITENENLKKKSVSIQKKISEHDKFFKTISHASDSGNIACSDKYHDQNLTLVSYYENIIDLIPEVVFWKDTTGTYLGCNKELLKIRNLTSKSTIIGKTDYDIFNADEANRLLQNDQLVIQTGQIIQVEEFIKNSKGEQAIYTSTKRPLRNSKNEIIGVLGVSTNITEQKENENKLVNEKESFEQEYDIGLKKLARISKEVTGQEIDINIPIEDHVLNIRSYLENIISCLPGLVYWKDQTGIYLGCNDGMMEWRGAQSKSEIVGKSDFEIFTHEEAALLRENDKRVMQQKKIISFEETVAMANDQTITYLTNKVPLLNRSKEAIGVLGISLDITEKVNAEKALSVAKDVAVKANKSKSEFLANMSHDLRAPLHGILGMSELLAQELENSPQIHHVKTMQQASTNLLEIIEEILSFAELDSQEQDLSQTEFCLPELLSQSIAIFSYAAKEKKLDLITEGINSLPQYILGHPKAIKRILNNLINNAIKFTDSGSIKISLSTNKSAILINVSDTGVGIPENQLTTIFEKFTRITPSYEGKYKGVGLGLAIVKEFLKRINGDISVESVIKKGTTFLVTIPLEVVAQPNIQNYQQDAVTENKLQLIKELHLDVLLIEDDHIGQKFGNLVLKSLNCNVTIASNGTEALNRLDRKYDIIFSDIGLPDIDGFEIVKNIRSHNSPNLYTITIAVTGHVAEKDEEKCYSAGFNDVLKKPLSADGFKKTIIKWLFPD